jgi:mannose-1-phosphate guanylyltransferase
VRALLLAAGVGSRLRPLTDEIPKCLAPIKGRPLLEFWLAMLARARFKRILVNTHYLPDMVREVVGGNELAPRIELVHEATLLGTGGTVRANAAFCYGGDVLVAHADNLSLFDPAEFMRVHAARPLGCEITMMTFETPTPQSCGIVVCDASGVVREFHEKQPHPPGNVANAAVYVFSAEVVRFLGSLKDSIVDLSTEIVPRYLGRILTWPNRRYHTDIGTLSAWREANRDYPVPPPAAPRPDPWANILERRSRALRRHIDGLLAGDA